MIFGQVKFDGADVRRLADRGAAEHGDGGFHLLQRWRHHRHVAGGGERCLLQPPALHCAAAFGSPESVAKFTRFIILAFLPVAAYGIYQQVYGFQEFEIEYLKTPGLTIEIKQLEANRVRAFSTLNSPTSLSVVVCSVAMMALSLALVGNRARAKLMSLPVAGLIVLLMVAGWACEHCAGGHSAAAGGSDRHVCLPSQRGDAAVLCHADLGLRRAGGFLGVSVHAH